MLYDGANITQLRSALASHGLHPNKRLGQNFLCDANVADAIVRQAGELSGRRVIEIGPGAGALTTRLLEKGARVVAVELDAGLCRLLSDRIEDDNFTLIHANALDVPFPDLLIEDNTTLVANLPYYITTPLLMRFLTESSDIGTMILMMQREVAQRLAAPPGGREYGSLSVAVSYYAAVSNRMSVSPSCFFPEPAVSSSVVMLSRRPYPQRPTDESLLFSVVRACFAMRRKTLLNNLAAMPALDKDRALRVLESCGIDKNVRAEQLSIDEFIALSNAVAEVAAGEA